MRCLFCKKEGSSTNGVEHVLPESIGNKKHVLPQGMVCDACNGYFARKVERPVLSHESFRNVRAWYQVPNKKGKIPSVSGVIAGTDLRVGMKKDKNGKIVITAERGKEQNEVEKYLQKMGCGEDFPPFIFSISLDPPKKEMSRFLAMMGLEALANRLYVADLYDQVLDDKHYDQIRNYARYGQGVDFWPFHDRVVFPMDTEMQHPETGEWVQVGFGHDLLITELPETYFMFMFYGVEFAINLGGPSVKGYENWLARHNQISPFVERCGAFVKKVQQNGKLTTRIYGSFSVSDGAAFDERSFLLARKNA